MTLQEIVQWILIAFLFLLLAIQDKVHRKERKDLYNRLMSKDYAEYSCSGKSKSVRNQLKKTLKEISERANEK
jgi:hypothetical protein